MTWLSQKRVQRAASEVSAALLVSASAALLQMVQWSQKRANAQYGKWYKPRTNFRSGSSGSRIPLTEAQKAARAAEKEARRREREAEKLAEKEAKAERAEIARRERKVHEAWRLRFEKTPHWPKEQHDAGRPRAPGKKDFRADVLYEQRVLTIRAACKHWDDIKACAIKDFPHGANAHKGEGVDRYCEFFIVLHPKAKRPITEMRAKISGAATREVKLMEWEPALAKEWKHISTSPDFVVLRDEAPPTKQDAKLLLEALGAGPSSSAAPAARPAPRDKEEEEGYNPNKRRSGPPSWEEQLKIMENLKKRRRGGESGENYYGRPDTE